MTQHSPIPLCPRCSQPTAWPLSGGAVFCRACRCWFRETGAGIESMAAGWPLGEWRPLGECP
ncbi:MAG TPA: hypothetical protein VE996_04515 [Terriglobales bacterium]|nr:hypothetical protein [Terriglobales bacterium]